MAGITDLPFRLLCKEQGADIVITEMISAKGMFYGNKNSLPLLMTKEEEAPAGVQLFGSEPDIIAGQAAKMKDYGYKTWGRRTGGGACSIAQYVTPDGMIYQISSSRSHTTYKNRVSIDSGTPVDIELTNEQMYDIEYLNSLFH